MTRIDWKIARELIDNDDVSFMALILAAANKAPEHYFMLRDRFPEFFHEYWDRHYGVEGYLRGENEKADAIYRQRDRDEKETYYD